MAFKSSLINNTKYLCNENGGVAYSNTGDPRLDYFSLIVRGSSVEKINNILDKCWDISPLDTIKLIFNKRDCRKDEKGNGGSGEKEIFLISLIWLRTKNYSSFEKNFQHIPFYGSYKDWCRLCEKNTDIKFLAAKLFALQLKDDIDNFKERKNVSLAAKYAPSINSHYDKICQLPGFIAIELGLKRNWERIYRKQFLSPLRAHINIVETKMCSKDWENIDYSSVPSQAMQLYKNSFKKHSPVTFENWLVEVSEGKKKINSQQLQPHELAKGYLCNNGFDFWSIGISKTDPVIEEQWKSLLQKTKEYYNFENTVIVSDLSGSMYGTPILVSYTLGCLVAKLSKPPFDNLLISFSEEPSFHDLSIYETLHDCIKSLKEANFSIGLRTDLYKTFEIIINKAKLNNVKDADFPKVLIIITDMQFDAATSSNENKPILERIDELFSKTEYTRPNIVFWNVRDVYNSAATINDPKLALVSGFSTSTFANILQGKDLSPMSVLRETLDCGRYDILKV